jgi:hypothetical protein
MEQHIDASSHLVTDEFPVYYMMQQKFPLHYGVKHRDKEYVRKEADINVTTNTGESFFALLKRSNYGRAPSHEPEVSRFLLCGVRLRYNGRKLTDDERTVKAIKATEGKRLMLKQPKNTD